MGISIHVLNFYGAFLIFCGVISVIFIGMKAKTALASGGISGILSMIIAYYDFFILGILLSLALFCVFSWRSTKTLHTIFKLIPSQHPDLSGKGIAFLIISLMAIVSLLVAGVQIVQLLNFQTYDFIKD